MPRTALLCRAAESRTPQNRRRNQTAAATTQQGPGGEAEDIAQPGTEKAVSLLWLELEQAAMEASVRRVRVVCVARRAIKAQFVMTVSSSFKARPLAATCAPREPAVSAGGQG